MCLECIHHTLYQLAKENRKYSQLSRTHIAALTTTAVSGNNIHALRHTNVIVYALLLLQQYYVADVYC
jgi:hypothetical protein